MVTAPTATNMSPHEETTLLPRLCTEQGVEMHFFALECLHGSLKQCDNTCVHGDGADSDTMRTNNVCMLIYTDVLLRLIQFQIQVTLVSYKSFPQRDDGASTELAIIIIVTKSTNTSVIVNSRYTETHTSKDTHTHTRMGTNYFDQNPLKDSFQISGCLRGSTVHGFQYDESPSNEIKGIKSTLYYFVSENILIKNITSPIESIKA